MGDLAATWTGFEREDGRKGVRNFVAVMAAADNVNPLARQLAAAVPGVVCLPASYGRGQLGADFELALRAMAGLAAHPNVASCLVVSFEPESGQRIASRVASLGRSVNCLSFLDEGGHEASLKKGTALLQKMLADAAQAQRVPLNAHEILIGLECGGSDTTSGLFGNPALGLFTDQHIDAGGTAIFSEPVECLGGEELLERRAVTPDVAARLIATVKAYDVLARSQGVDLAGVNPTPDNMAGGLTTIEEKSLGALAKTGSRPIQGVLAYGERPVSPGLWMMDAPAAAVENITALAAGGAQIICFVTGSCNPSGHPLAPTIKISANPVTAAQMPTHLDVDLGAMLTGSMNLREGATHIREAVKRVAEGALTAAERLDYLETNISRIGPSV
ncbi:UxaA family hydrolase [Microvirga massiliensis]|uniref:UxaA family hydrolase n=1 Tax=Microvirga massiliensis TaxID=1033741 RepID=UPI00062BB1B3|nr:UxaA family hydrolase [Microvirga massiliensis]